MIGGSPRAAIWVLTSTWCDGERLIRTYRSLLAQHSPYWRWLLIDDGSPTGHGVDVLPQQLDERVTVWKRTTRRGKAVRLNEALAVVRGEWCLELDGDDWLFPDTVHTALVLSRKHQRADLIYGDRLLFVPERGGKVRRLRWFRGYQVTRLSSWRRRPLPFGPRLYRVRALRQLGGWPTNGFGRGQFYEDIELLDRIFARRTAVYAPRLRDCVLISRTGVTGRNRGEWSNFLTYLSRKREEG